MFYYLFACIIAAYLIGSFSTAYWFGKWFYKIDIRELGSKNAGATNIMRVLGYKAAIPVFITDVLKSAGATQLVYVVIFFVPEIDYYSETSYIFQIILGAGAVIGHIFPVFTNFAGGKGVASLLGIVLAMHPVGALIAIVIFTLTLFIFKIVSVGSLVAAISFPVLIYIMEGAERQTLLIFSIIACLLVIITHAKNIKRILKGEEKKIFSKK